MDSLGIEKSERWISPRKVPKPDVIRIFESDPRNNPTFLAQNGNVIVLPDPEDYQPGQEEFYADPDYQEFTLSFGDNFTSEAVNVPEPEKYQDQSVDASHVEAPSLLPPQNLAASNFELKTAAGDGTITYTLNVFFDEALGAKNYIYTLNEVSS